MVSRSPSKGYAESWLVESNTDATKKYIVSKRPDGTFACDCPAWKFHKAPKPDCKHIDGVKANVFGNIDLQPKRELAAPQNNIEVKFNGVLIGWITEEQAERFKANMATLAAERRPPETVSQFGDFTIRRKFKLGGDA